MKKVLISLILLVTYLLIPISALASPVEEVKDYITNYYKGTLPKDFESYTTIEQMERSLDPYSDYFTKAEFEAYLDAINQQLVGIGIIIQEHEQGILLLDVIDNGPAAKVGLEPGDIITKADGQSLQGKSVQIASSHIVGEEGTSVQVEFIKSDGSIHTVTIVREVIKIPNVQQKMLYGNIGYIQLSSFSEDAGVLVSNAILTLKSKGAKKYIFDLRNNGGGFVSTAEDIIGLFPNSPKAYHLYYKNGEEVGLSTAQTTTFPVQTKVLVNGLSASASEMTAAALRDQLSARLYGQLTYGKGSMQTFLSISNGDYLKLTVAEFTGPNGTLVNKVGVQPHKVTSIGKELTTAHMDYLKITWPTYKKLSSLSAIPLDKKFTVTFNQDMKDIEAMEAIELVELGGESIPITISRIDSKKFQVQAKSLLQINTSYVLVIHPKLRNIQDKMMKKGAYVEMETIDRE